MSTITINNFPKNEIWFAKTKENGQMPTKRAEDAGYDIYPAFDEDYICIGPHETKMIPTGICSAFSSDYVVILKERGSTGTKGIGQRCGVIDSGYRGEWMIPITNHNDIPLYITKSEYAVFEGIEYPYYKAICQALLMPVIHAESVEKTVEEINSITSERGTGKLGSSGK